MDNLAEDAATRIQALGMGPVHAVGKVRRREGTGGTTAGEKTVHDVTHDLVRSLGLTTVFGDPGSTGQSVLAEFSGRIDRCTGLRIHR